MGRALLCLLCGLQQGLIDWALAGMTLLYLEPGDLQFFVPALHQACVKPAAILRVWLLQPVPYHVDLARDWRLTMPCHRSERRGGSHPFGCYRALSTPASSGQPFYMLASSTCCTTCPRWPGRQVFCSAQAERLFRNPWECDI